MLGSMLSDFGAYWSVLRSGMVTTILLFLATLPLSFLLALPVTSARNADHRVPRLLAHGFILFFRGAPLLPVLFILYYGLPKIPGLKTSVLWPLLRDPFPIAVLALTFNSAAFQSEILAGAIRMVPRGELEAASVAGFSRAGLLRFIIVPHVVRIASRAFGNEIVFVLKATAVASFITLQDVMGAANAVYLRSFDPLTPLVIAGLFYLAIVAFVQEIARRLSRRPNSPHDSKISVRRL